LVVGLPVGVVVVRLALRDRDVFDGEPFEGGGLALDGGGAFGAVRAAHARDPFRVGWWPRRGSFWSRMAARRGTGSRFTDATFSRSAERAVWPRPAQASRIRCGWWARITAVGALASSMPSRSRWTGGAGPNRV